VVRTALAVAVGILAAAPAVAQEKKVTLRWFGQSFFQLETTGGKKIVFDPHAIPEFGTPKGIKADIILISHLHNDHNYVDAVDDHASARVFNGLKEGPKGRTQEWNKIDEKVGAVKIRTVGTYHDAVNGMTRGKNAIFIVEVDGLTFCHLGDLGHELDPATVKLIGPVDVLMVPVGGVYTINGEQARKVTAAINPRLYAIPMHFGVKGYDDLLPPDEFLEGQKSVKKFPRTNELVIPVDLKANGYTVAVLNWKKEEPGK
jgi:L-ascorbate metabolism protein UlaG (beta-lactamase superfamily)